MASDGRVPMQSALADWLTTSQNRGVEGKNVNTNTNSCRVAAWFNQPFQKTAKRGPRLTGRALGSGQQQEEP